MLDRWDVVFSRAARGRARRPQRTTETVRVLMFSTVRHLAVTVYPDSDKIGIWTGNEDDDLMVRRTSGVDYYDGEAGSAT